MENKNLKIGNDEASSQETEMQNKCKFCGRVIGDIVSNYHIGCYKQKQLLEKNDEDYFVNSFFEENN